jgi:hypothetical protein
VNYCKGREGMVKSEFDQQLRLNTF